MCKYRINIKIYDCGVPFTELYFDYCMYDTIIKI